MKQQNNCFKVVLAGNEGVGKTSIIFWLTQRRFVEGFHATVGANISDWYVNIHGTDYQTKLWDTAGQERYRSLAPIYFRDSKAAVVVYDVRSKHAAEAIESWITTFREATGPNTIIVIAGNKCDILSADEYDAAVTKMKELTDHFEVDGYLVSAKTGEGISRLFESVMEKIIRSSPENSNSAPLCTETDAQCKC